MMMINDDDVTKADNDASFKTLIILTSGDCRYYKNNRFASPAAALHSINVNCAYILLYIWIYIYILYVYMYTYINCI